MPIYEYECEKCGNVEEVLQKFSDRPLKKCNSCSGRLHKLVSHSSFHLKGTGWYITDYAKKRKSGGSNTSSNKKEGAPATKSKKSKKSTDKAS